MKHFKLELPEYVELFYSKGIRIGCKGLKDCKIFGELGYAASDAGFNPTNSFIQNFGHLVGPLGIDKIDALKVQHNGMDLWVCLVDKFAEPV